jgi:flagellar basal body-associated protein FliL
MRFFNWVGKVIVGFVVVCLSVLLFVLIPLGLVLLVLAGVAVVYWTAVKSLWTTAFKAYKGKTI